MSKEVVTSTTHSGVSRPHEHLDLTPSSGVSLDKQMIYLRYVDELTPSHMQMLQFLDDPPRYLEERGLAWPDSTFKGSLMSVVQIAFPDWARDEPFLSTLNGDLEALGLASNPRPRGWRAAA